VPGDGHGRAGLFGGGRHVLGMAGMVGEMGCERRMVWSVSLLVNGAVLLSDGRMSLPALTRTRRWKKTHQGHIYLT
jgi:hypothetical protein